MIGKCFLSYLLIAVKNQLIEAAALPSSNLTLQRIKKIHTMIMISIHTTKPIDWANNRKKESQGHQNNFCES